MKDYAAMSDQQINQLVCCKIGNLKIGQRGACCVVSGGDALTIKLGAWQVFDPCNNPADAWPILLENNISLVKWQHDDVWAAWSGAGMAYGEVECEHIEHDENPLRAAMIVFLMMKEGE